MPIPTTPGLEGFIKSRPRMTMTVNGDPRMSCWVGIPQSQQDANGAWHEAEPLEAEMVMFGSSAQKAFAKIRPGDHIVATGKEASYPIEQDGQIVGGILPRLAHRPGQQCHRVHRPPRPRAVQRRTRGHPAGSRSAGLVRAGRAGTAGSCPAGPGSADRDRSGRCRPGRTPSRAPRSRLPRRARPRRRCRRSRPDRPPMTPSLKCSRSGSSRSRPNLTHRPRLRRGQTGSPGNPLGRRGGQHLRLLLVAARS